MPIDNLPDGEVAVRIMLDASSVELFINGGQYGMIAQLFPTNSYAEMVVENKGKEEALLSNFQLSAVTSVWN